MLELRGILLLHLIPHKFSGPLEFLVWHKVLHRWILFDNEYSSFRIAQTVPCFLDYGETGQGQAQTCRGGCKPSRLRDAMVLG